ncbi:MAG TPA: DMT family transporter [Solirubrobacterales bacterium]|nr:DMT family transporter [Solirubrobacterales bacterium]
MSARAWTAFAIVSVLWGIPYLFISIAVEDGISPGFLAWSRVVLGAAVLLPLAWRAGALSGLRGHWRWLLVYATLEIAIPFPLIALGEEHVSSSVAAILIAASPLLVAVLARLFDHTERVGGRRLAGLVAGFAGVVALVGVDIAGDRDELLGAIAILIAAVGYAAGPMTLQARLATIDPLAIMAGALALAAVLLTPLAALSPPGDAVPAEAIVSIAVLGILCTAAAFVLFGALVIDVGAGRALVITYIAPVVALIAGIVVLGESPGVGTLIGLPLILAGSRLATGAD